MKLRALFVISLLCLFTKAQNYGSFAISPYAGVLGINFQPANLANTPYKWDINVLSASAEGLIKELLPEANRELLLYQGEQYSLSAMLATRSQNFFVSANIYTPCLSYKINNKSGIAFTWRFRVAASGNVSSADFHLLAENEFDMKSIANRPVLNSLIGVANTWQEFGLSYGLNVWEENRHRIDVGATAKYLIGGASGYVEAEKLSVEYDENTNTITNFQGKLNLIFNENLEQLYEGESSSLFNAKGYSFTLGMKYEYKDLRPSAARNNRIGAPEYLFKISTSVRDMGEVFYKSSKKSATYSLDLNQPISPNYFENITSLSDLSTRLQNIFNYSVDQTPYYSLRTPTTFNLNIDWHIGQGFYLNGLTDLVYYNMKERISESSRLWKWGVGARYERERYGFYFSAIYNDFSKWGTTFSARYRFFHFGLSNLFKFANDDSLNTIGVIFSLKFSIWDKGIKQD